MCVSVAKALFLTVFQVVKPPPVLQLIKPSLFPVFQSLKPRNGLFCMLIQQVRETSALEMPDRENTLVLKGDGPLEYVIEAPDAMELRLWLHAIQQCIVPAAESVSSEEVAAMSVSLLCL